MQRMIIGMAILLSSPSLIFSMSNKKAEEKKMEQEGEVVAANEDLMREHGILNRLLMIYQEISGLIFLRGHSVFLLQEKYEESTRYT